MLLFELDYFLASWKDFSFNLSFKIFKLNFIFDFKS